MGATKGEREKALQLVYSLSSRIEKAVPLISLAIVASRAGAGAGLTGKVDMSPGRVMQAARELWVADEKFSSLKRASKAVEVGPAFGMVYYRVFESRESVTWKEEQARSEVQVWRVDSLSATGFGVSKKECEYRYLLTVKENFDDGRYHEKYEKPKLKVLELEKVQRLFFTASGQLLELEDSKSPVLVLKMNIDDDQQLKEENTLKSDIANEPPAVSETAETENEELADTSFLTTSQFENSQSDWIAFEEYLTSSPTSSEDEDEGEDKDKRSDPLSTQLESMTLSTSNSLSSSSLSLLEYIIRMAALQCRDQMSVYDVTDERLRMYLTDGDYNDKDDGWRSRSKGG